MTSSDADVKRGLEITVSSARTSFDGHQAHGAAQKYGDSVNQRRTVEPHRQGHANERKNGRMPLYDEFRFVSDLIWRLLDASPERIQEI